MLACSGLFLIAKTGLFDWVEATVPRPYARMFARTLPCRPGQPRAGAGRRRHAGRLVSSGASTCWHDLVLYLIGGDVEPVASAGSIQVLSAAAGVWTRSRPSSSSTRRANMAMRSSPKTGLIRTRRSRPRCARWCDTRVSPSTAYGRRFRTVTGHAPPDYVQRLWGRAAKARLERIGEAIEKAGRLRRPSAFRSIFRRIAGISPS